MKYPSPSPRFAGRRLALGTILTLALALPGSVVGDHHETETSAKAVTAYDFEGLYDGAIVYRPEQAELEATVELGVDGEGNLTGTIDMDAFKMLYHPLEEMTLDGAKIAFSYRRYSETRGPNALFEFEGELVEKDGQKWLQGDFIEQRGRIPFRFDRIGDLGSPRPERPESEVVDMAPAGAELAAAFNEDHGKVRLVTLLSPNCGVCLSSARLMQRHLMEKIAGDDLQIYVVWGPMLGGEERPDAVAATSYLHDTRATHFWTPEHDLAIAYSSLVGLSEEEKAWDTFLLYGPDARWEGKPPAPATIMHVNKPLPKEQNLDTKALREEIESMLASSEPETADAAPGAASTTR
ncbi:MAG: hypothetical protein AAF481_12695 [Acidobacteriota bacterium]